MKSCRIKTVVTLAVMAMACFAMTTPANAAMIAIPLTVDTANSNQTSYGVINQAIVNDAFAYDVNATANAVKPIRDAGYDSVLTTQYGGAWYGTIMDIDFDDNYYVSFVDIWSRRGDNSNPTRHEDMTFTFYKDLGTLQTYQVTNVDVGASDFLRLVLPADIIANRFTITKDTGISGVLNLTEVRVGGTEVPEPATMSLLALGGLGVLLKRRRGRA